MSFPNMSSIRLSLREHLDSDANDYYNLLSDESAVRYYGRNTIDSLSEAKSEISALHTKYLMSESIKWAVILDAKSIYIGSVGIKDFTNQHHRGTLSCIFSPRYWHFGYASEALKLVIVYAFETLKLNRIQAYVDPINVRAMSLFKKLGFSCEAILHEYEFERKLSSREEKAILRLIKIAADNAHKHGAWIGICGELGADLALTETFLAMGIDELSVSPTFILGLRKKIRETNVAEIREQRLAELGF